MKVKWTFDSVYFGASQCMHVRIYKHVQQTHASHFFRCFFFFGPVWRPESAPGISQVESPVSSL